MYFLS